MISAGSKPSPTTPARLYAARNATNFGLLLANNLSNEERIDYCDVALSAVSAGNVELLTMLMAVGADLNAVNAMGDSPRREMLGKRMAIPTREQVDAMRRRIPSTAFFAIKARATHICIGLQSLGLDALCMCTIIACACDPMSRLVPFHQVWSLATTVKHFHS